MKHGLVALVLIMILKDTATFQVLFIVALFYAWNILWRLTVAFTYLKVKSANFRLGIAILVLSVAYIGPKSRTERPMVLTMKTKIGTEVAHVTCDLDTTFNVKRSKVKVTRPVYSTQP